MNRPTKPAEWNPPANPEVGARYAQSGVELEWNGRNWLPVVNARNYPKLFNPDGTRKAA
jgi:hypothetical protein